MRENKVNIKNTNNIIRIKNTYFKVKKTYTLRPINFLQKNVYFRLSYSGNSSSFSLSLCFVCLYSPLSDTLLLSVWRKLDG